LAKHILKQSHRPWSCIKSHIFDL